MSFNTFYSHSSSVPVRVEGDSLTRQDCKRECDINYIVARAGIGLTQIPDVAPTYCDLADVPMDFISLNERLRRARDQFMRLPSKVRARFGNDAAAFCAFLNDEANRPEAVRLGLVPPPPAAAPDQEPNN